MSGRPKQPVVGSTEEQLRGLVREAHAAVKDLRDVIRQARAFKDQFLGDVERAAHEAGSEELARYNRHLQSEMNQHTKALAEGVEQARQSVVKALVMSKLVPSDDGLKVIWKGPNFSPVPLPDGPEMGPEVSDATAEA